MSPKQAARVAGIPDATFYRYLERVPSIHYVKNVANKEGLERLGLKLNEQLTSKSKPAGNGHNAHVSDDGLPALTPDVLADIHARPGRHDGQLFRLQGEVTRHGEVSEEVEQALEAEPGVAARFRMDCAHPGGRFDVTVFAVLAEHGDVLVERLHDHGEVTAIIRVVFKPIVGGFRTLGPERHGRRYALVLIEIEHSRG